MVNVFGALVLLTQLSIACGHKHAVVATCCDCQEDSAKVERLIHCLQTSHLWKVRDDAAHDLRQFSWKCHPGIVEALAGSLLNDCHEEVREEAAQSLTKLAPCHPAAYFALDSAACRDRDGATRHQAKRGLKALGSYRPEPAQIVIETPTELLVPTTTSPFAPMTSAKKPTRVERR